MTPAEYFMEMAFLTARRSTCQRAQVGCVLIDNNTRRILAVGYNSSISGTAHCSEDGCLIHNGHCIRCPHAEIAALMNLSTKNSTSIDCYVTHQPCINCFKALATAGVTTIYYSIPYKDEARDLLVVTTPTGTINRLGFPALPEMIQFKGA